MLLYKIERQQYKEVIVDNISPSRVYGAEHLLRLFVKLPVMLADLCIEMETDSTTSNITGLSQVSPDPPNYILRRKLADIRGHSPHLRMKIPRNFLQPHIWQVRVLGETT